MTKKKKKDGQKKKVAKGRNEDMEDDIYIYIYKVKNREPKREVGRNGVLTK